MFSQTLKPTETEKRAGWGLTVSVKDHWPLRVIIAGKVADDISGHREAAKRNSEGKVR